jgi:hypothetical protein
MPRAVQALRSAAMFASEFFEISAICRRPWAQAPWYYSAAMGLDPNQVQTAKN